MPRSLSRSRSPPRKGRHRSSARSPSPASHRHSTRRRRETYRSRSPVHHGHSRCVTVSKQWALHAVVVGLETAMRESEEEFVRKRWVSCTHKKLLRKKTKRVWEWGGNRRARKGWWWCSWKEGFFMLLLPGGKLEGFGKVLSSGTFQSLLMYRRLLPLW